MNSKKFQIKLFGWCWLLFLPRLELAFILCVILAAKIGQKVNNG